MFLTKENRPAMLRAWTGQRQAERGGLAGVILIDQRRLSTSQAEK